VKIINQYFCKKKTSLRLREKHNSSSKTGMFRSMESMELLSVAVLQAVITSHGFVVFYNCKLNPIFPR
jgi:hypothetical protein